MYSGSRFAMWFNTLIYTLFWSHSNDAVEPDDRVPSLGGKLSSLGGERSRLSGTLPSLGGSLSRLSGRVPFLGRKLLFLGGLSRCSRQIVSGGLAAG